MYNINKREGNDSNGLKYKDLEYLQREKYRGEEKNFILICAFLLLIHVGFAEHNEISQYKANEITDMEVLYRNALLGVNELSDMAKDKVVSFSDVYALKGGIKDDKTNHTAD